MDASPYRYNSVNASRPPWDQMTALQAAFAAATAAEATNNRVRRITQSQISTQAFPTNVNQSVAEKTIQKYTKLSNDCWGAEAVIMPMLKEMALSLAQTRTSLESLRKPRRKEQLSMKESRSDAAPKSAP
jgi:hypothetical protein